MNALIELVKAGTACSFVHTVAKNGWHSLECKVSGCNFAAQAEDPDAAAQTILAAIKLHQETVQKTQAERDRIESRVNQFARERGALLAFGATLYYGETCPPTKWARAYLDIGAKKFDGDFGTWNETEMRATLMEVALEWIEQTSSDTAAHSADAQSSNANE